MKIFFNFLTKTLIKSCLPIFLFAIVLPAQPNIEWQKCLGGSDVEHANSIQQTSDGGFVVAGKTLSTNGDVTGNHGFNDFWVVKLSGIGAVQWKKTYGGTNNDRGYSIHQTTDGGYIVAGQTASNDGNVSGLHGNSDFWIIKLDAFGNLQWQKALGGSNLDEAWSVRQTADGGYILAGRTLSMDGDVTDKHGSFDFWVVKIDGNGTLQWQRALGGSGVDIAYSVRQSFDGGFIVTGESESNDGDALGQHGNGDFWVVKLAATGVIEWQKMLGSSGIDRANDICPTKDGGYIVVGQASANNGDVTGNHGGFDIWIVKLDSLGVIQWQKSLGGSSEDYGQSVYQTSDGGYIIAGSSPSTDGDVIGNDGGIDMWVIKLTPTGELKWQKTMGGQQADEAYSIQPTSDGGYFVAGFTKSNSGDVSGFHGVQDYWVVKLSPESVGIPEIAASAASLEIYPNPASQTIALQSAALEGVRFALSISDFLGRELLQKKDLMPNTPVDISALPTGIYLLTARTDSGRVLCGKFRKQD